MPELIKKTINCAVKEIAERTIEFVGSMDTPDRMGDRVHADGWMLDNYKKNPVFLWCHDYRQPPIGKAIEVSPAEGKLLFKIQFAMAETYPFADTIYKLYKGGFLNAVSVGFAPQDFKEYAEDGKEGIDYNKQELLELSACPIPAHPDALVSARSQGLITVKEFEVITKPEETDETIRVPVPKEVGKHEDCKIRTIPISEKEGIQALYCIDHKVNITYLFDKDKWDMARAKDWVKEHSKAMTQAAIADEIDYCASLMMSDNLSDDNLSDDNRQRARTLAQQIYKHLDPGVVILTAQEFSGYQKRNPGGDMPDEYTVGLELCIATIEKRIGGK